MPALDYKVSHKTPQPSHTLLNCMPERPSHARLAFALLGPLLGRRRFELAVIFLVPLNNWLADHGHPLKAGHSLLVILSEAKNLWPARRDSSLRSE